MKYKNTKIQNYMNNKKEKAISLRLTEELYQKYIDKAIELSNKENRIVKISEVIREVLEKGI